MRNLIWIIILCACVVVNLYVMGKGGNPLFSGVALGLCLAAIIANVIDAMSR